MGKNYLTVVYETDEKTKDFEGNHHNIRNIINGETGIVLLHPDNGDIADCTYFRC